MWCILLGLFPWELQLPWAPITLKYDAGVRLERVDRDCGLACARGVIVSICQRVGTSVTVTTRTVSGKSVVGRRRGARPCIARTPRLDFAMPRRRGSAVDEPRSLPKPLRTWTLRPRVVTRQKFFSLSVCDRPGCYDAPVASPRNPARYCCPACRRAVRNVLDRERKWIARDTLAGRVKRAIEYQAARRQRSEAPVHHRRWHTAAPARE
jgi:hypothetical protein